MSISVPIAPVPAEPHVWRGRLGRLLVLGLAGVPLLLALKAKFPLCVSAGLFGLPCPGCGLTRASLLLLHGDLGGALSLHPLVVPMAPLYFGALALLAVDYVRGPRQAPSLGHARARPWLSTRTVTLLGALLLTSLVGLWLARFVGFFGGPVPVESYQSWAASRAELETPEPAPSAH